MKNSDISPDTSAASAVLEPSVAKRQRGSRSSVGIVSHIKIVSDKVPDVSSLAAWKRSYIRDEMSDRDKALAIWRTISTFQHQDYAPREDLSFEGTVLDVIKIANVYGYSFCSVATAETNSLAAQMGIPARGWTVRKHVVPELYFDGKWQMLDASLVNYYPAADGRFASLDEIMAEVRQWLNEHPEYDHRPDDEKDDFAKRLIEFARDWGWKKGPALLADCDAYDRDGYLPAKRFNWAHSMEHYSGVLRDVPEGRFPYVSAYTEGYQVNIQLRPGERLVRNWSNKGLHTGKTPPIAMDLKAGTRQAEYMAEMGDLSPGRLGNGELEYDVPLAGGAFRSGALEATNLDWPVEQGADTAVCVADAAEPGVIVLRMPSSYLYLTGSVQLDAVIGKGGSIELALSDNHGLDWQDVARITQSGPHRIDLGDLVRRRYDYRLRLTLRGLGTGLNSLRIHHDILQSQRALPALGEGSNTIRFSAGPQEGTVSIEPGTRADRPMNHRHFHARLENINDDEGLLVIGGAGSVTFPIETPGAMTRIRFGAGYQTKGDDDTWEYQVSFDDGETFHTVHRVGGMVPGGSFESKYVTFEDIPPGTKRALIRYAGRSTTKAILATIRIDADFREPAGGFQPVKVTYIWEEQGQEKHHAHIARHPQETYQIQCGSRPVMKRLIMELDG